MPGVKSIRKSFASASGRVAITLLAFTQIAPAGTLHSGTSGSQTRQTRVESIEVVTNPRTMNPHRIAVSIDSAPSLTVKKNQEYDVKWEVPSSGSWYVAISKRPVPDSSQSNSWEQYRSWGGAQTTSPAKILSQDLGPQGKCLITIWYDSADVDKKSAGQLTAMPFAGSSETTVGAKGKRSKQIIFEFKLMADQPVTAKVIISRPA